MNQQRNVSTGTYLTTNPIENKREYKGWKSKYYQTHFRFIHFCLFVNIGIY